MSDTDTETETPHPAACPHCGGMSVSVAQPDYLLRPAVLNDDGSITIGENDDSSDFEGLTLLFCTSCSSMYPQPASVVERFQDGLKVDYPQSPRKDEPGHKGERIVWLPLMPEQIDMITSALDTHEYWELGDRLPRNNGCVFIPEDEGSDRYWDDDDEPDDDQEDAIEAIKRARAIADFVTEERVRQLTNQPNHTRPED